MQIRLRPAVPEDMEAIFEWRNDPWIVQLSAGQSTVEWEEHVSWFQRTQAASDHLLYLVEPEPGKGIGCVRFDRKQDTAAVTIFLLRQFTGQGYGTVALREACRQAFETWPDLRYMVATIRKENTPSIRSFTKVGFSLLRSPQSGDARTIEMVLESRVNN